MKSSLHVLRANGAARFNRIRPADTSQFRRIESLTVYDEQHDRHVERRRLRKIEREVIDAVNKRSHREVSRLKVSALPGKIVVTGKTKTFYQRQLVDSAVLHYIKPFAGEFDYDSRVRVD